MAYCTMNGVEVKVPERALRPREPAPPPPSKTMASPMVASRMLRPRTKAEKAMTGVDVKAALAKVRQLKAQQRKYEARLKVLVKKLREMQAGLGAVSAVSSVSTAEQVRALQKQIDALLACIKKLAADANQLAMDAIKGGASQEDVRAAAGEKSVERTPVASPPAAPVIETSTPAVLPDGSVVPGPDAKVTTPDTGKPVAPEGEVSAKADDEGKTSPLLWGVGLLAAWWAWKKLKAA